MDRAFTNPNSGNSASVSQDGNDVAVIFHCSDRVKADKMFRNILAQLKEGTLNITMMAGKAASVTESEIPAAAKVKR